MNLKDFSLLKEDTEGYTIGHPKGKSMRVAKRGLSDKAQKLISQLRREQHFDEGTPEGTEMSPEPPETITFQPVNQVASLSPASLPQNLPQVTKEAEKEAVDQSGEEEEEPETAKAEPASPLAPAPASQAPSSAPSPTSALEKAQKDIEAGVNAQKRAGYEEAKAYGEQQQSLGQIQKTYDEHYQALSQKGLQLEDAINKQQIDPDRWYNNQSTGSKIASAIGLVLSGLGSGITGGPNLVQQNIDRAISSDIAAQQSDQSKKMNLWKMNREMMGSDLQATMATQNQMLLATKSKLAQAAAQAQGPLAQQAAANALAQIGQQIDLNHWAQSRLAGGQPGTESQHLNEMEVMAKLNPAARKEMEEKYLPGIGVARVPVSPKVREELAEFSPIRTQLQRAEDFQRNKAGSLGTFKGSELNAEAEGITNSLKVMLNKLYGLNRLTEIEYHNFESQIPHVGSFRSGAALKQIENLNKQLSDHENSVLSGAGVTRFKKAPSDDQARAWAQEQLQRNPQDPQAIAILQMASPQGPASQVAMGSH